MGRLLLDFGDGPRRVPLGASTRIGRHWSNDALVDHPGMPLHWLELRWAGRQWTWRALGAADRTVGAGAADGEGWRPFAKGPGKARVKLDGMGWVELVDPSEPALLLHDLTNGERLEAEDVEEYVELGDDGARPLGVRPHPPLQDGQVFTSRGRTLRILHAESPTPTATTALDVRALACHLDVAEREATFTVERTSRTLRGEGARILRVYAEARLRGGEGWLSPLDAFAEWVAAGGQPESPVERVAWERGKVRTRLSLADVAGGPELFEVEREGPSTRVRLSIPAERITVDGRGPGRQGGTR